MSRTLRRPRARGGAGPRGKKGHAHLLSSSFGADGGHGRLPACGARLPVCSCLTRRARTTTGPLPRQKEQSARGSDHHDAPFRGRLAVSPQGATITTLITDCQSHAACCARRALATLGASCRSSRAANQPTPHRVLLRTATHTTKTRPRHRPPAPFKRDPEGNGDGRRRLPALPHPPAMRCSRPTPDRTARAGATVLAAAAAAQPPRPLGTRRHDCHEPLEDSPHPLMPSPHPRPTRRRRLRHHRLALARVHRSPSACAALTLLTRLRAPHALARTDRSCQN